MFSAKNYGLPKELIEAAKRVHEKQLEEQQVPIVRAPEGRYKERPSDASKETIRAADKNEKKAQEDLRKKELDSLSDKLRRVRENLPPLPERNPNNEEVQFTEEELAEAFAIFLEENFHVEMLTEEDIDYVFENEFPQWLEEGLTIRPKTAAEIKKEKEEEKKRREEQRKRDDEEAKKNEKIPMV
jgi:hypothetical protein